MKDYVLNKIDLLNGKVALLLAGIGMALALTAPNMSKIGMFYEEKMPESLIK